MNERSTRLADWLVEQLCGRRLPPPETARARAWLLQAAAALGLVDITSNDPFPAASFRYQGIMLVAAIEGAARDLLAEAYQPGRWRAAPGGEPVGLPSLRTAGTVPYRDPNIASRAQLAALPGLGPVTSARIVRARIQRPFEDLDVVRRIAGVSADAWAATTARLSLDPAVTARSAPEPLPVARLSEAARQGRGPVVGMAGAAPGQALRASLILCCQMILLRPVVSFLFAPSQRRLDSNALAIARYADSPRVASPGVALVSDGAYLPLTQELLDSAQTSIRIAMFFIDGGSVPVQDLVQRLAAARGRGVRVRVVIGDDLPGDRHGAADTNAQARRLLRDVDIQTRPHWPEMALHEKSVLVDGRWTLTGSHNWTPRSLFGAGETSVCADSPGLTAGLEGRFDVRWAALDLSRDRRRVATSLLDQLTGTQRDALAAARVPRPSQLPAGAGLRAIATATRIPLGTLGLARRSAALMEALRVCETTAVLLIEAGLGTPTAARRASRRTLTSALSRPVITPPRMAGQRVAPQIAAALAEEDDDA